MTPFGRSLGAVVLRTLFYLAILAGVWAVSNITEAAPPAFIYQGF